MLDSLSIAQSGMTVHRTFLDATADNIANINTARRTNDQAFQARRVVAAATNYQGATQFEAGTGARVAGVAFGDPVGRIVYQPENPLADAEGLVRMPDMDLGAEMTNLILAQRGYQAQTATVKSAVDAYQTAIEIGRR